MKRNFYIILLGLIISVISTFVWSYKEKNKFKIAIKREIEDIFEGEKIISSGENNVFYAYIKVVDPLKDQNIIDKFPKKTINTFLEISSVNLKKSNVKDPTIIATPFISGLEFIKLMRNSAVFNEPSLINTEDLISKEETEFSIDSIVSTYLIYYGKVNDKFKNLEYGEMSKIHAELSEILANETDKFLEGLANNDKIGYSNQKLESIRNFPKLNNRYYSFQRKKHINARSGIFDTWYDSGDYRLVVTKNTNNYVLKENDSKILYEKVKFFGITLFVYIILTLIIFIVIKIFKN